MERKTVVRLGLVALCAAPLAANSQAKLPRVAVMSSPSVPNLLTEAFKRGMREQGYNEGENIEFSFHSAQGRPERFPALAVEVIKTKPDVIVSGGGTPSARAAMRGTKSIPIVFPASGDPVGEGLVQSLGHPGWNATGFSINNPEISGKRVQLVRELLPRAKRIAIFQDPVLRAGVDQIGATEEAARQLGMQVLLLAPAKPEEYESNYAIARSAGADALIVLPSSSFNANRKALLALSAKHSMATIWEHRQFTQEGGLLSYGPDITDLYRASARYVDRILKGAKPAELPVERASKFELVINIKTAKAQGVTIPSAVRVLADRVIE